MRVALGICCLGFLVSCYFVEGNVLDSLKKVSSDEAFESDSSDDVRALQLSKRHVTEEVGRSRQKRGSSPSVNFYRRTIHYSIVSGVGSYGWKKLVESDFDPVTLTILRRGFVGGMHDDVEFVIDRSVVQFININVVGDCEDLVITSPDGNNTRIPLGRNKRINAVVERADSFGVWMITANTDFNNTCSVRVTASCTTGFTMSLMTKYSYENDSAYRAIEGNPNKNKSLAVILDGFGMEALKSGAKDMVDTVRFVNYSGYDVINPVHVTDDANGLNSKVEVYLNDGLRISQIVYVIIEGRDHQGNRFTRVIPQPIRPSHVTLTCEPHDVIIQTGVETTFNVIIRNHGQNDTFTVDSSDTASLTNPRHEVFQMDSNVTRVFPLSARAGIRSTEGTAGSLNFVVRGSLPGSSQQTSCNIVVGKPSNPRIDSLTIDGTINSRFAETVVTSVMTNYADVGLEAKFDILLPVDAFITKLTMTLDDVTVVGIVEEKEKAKKIYEKAKMRGETTGHVAARESSTRVFKTSLFVGPGKEVTFKLTYQQLLGRSGGSYKYTIALNPNQLVNTLKISVHIEEQEEIDYITIPYFDKITSDKARHPAGTTVTFENRRRSAHIQYNPLPAQQTAFRTSNTFSILYDVLRTKVYGDVIVANGYFAHFYTPLFLAPAPKKVMFIIDKSGSMGIVKMNQVKEAMQTILKSLDGVDFFDVIFFDHATSRGTLRRATAQNVKTALKYVSSVRSGGGTLIIPAFLASFGTFNRHFAEVGIPNTKNFTEMYQDRDAEDDRTVVTEDDYVNLIVFLTDGQGESPSEVLRQIKRNNIHKIAIHTIAFGQDAARDLLQAIAAQHDGTYRMVFDGLTATAQIEDFFQEIAAPALRNISIQYPVNRVADVTKSKFQVIRSKSEIVWAGRIKEEEELLGVGLDENFNRGEDVMINAHLSGFYLDEALEFDIPIDPNQATSRILTSQYQIANFTERLWAFLQIKDLLKELVLAKGNPNASALIEEKALNLSLQYNFVTPLTSMVVVLPEALKDIEEELKNEERNERLNVDESGEAGGGGSGRGVGSGGSGGTGGAGGSGGSGGSGGAGGSRGGVGRGGAFGDPHFIIPLRWDINLCFNWDGEDGEVYNLFYDPSAGVTVNGKLIRIEAQEGTGKDHKTYFAMMGFVLPNHNLKILIRPETVTLISKGIRNIILPVLSNMTITRHGVRLRMYDVKFRSAKIELLGEDWIFQISIIRNTHDRYRASHLDFVVDSYKNYLKAPLNGIIGQFFNSTFRVDHNAKSNRTMMTINNRSCAVKLVQRKPHYLQNKIMCLTCNATHVIEDTREHYLLEDVLTSPTYLWI